MGESTIGTRLRTLRRWRGMTLTELAGLSGLSAGFLSMAERGLRSLDRRSHIAALASALRVSETELTGGPHLSADPVQSDPHSGIPALRVALETATFDRPAVGHARPLSELARLMGDRIEPARRASDYITVGADLPVLIDELVFHAAAPVDGAAHRLALETLIEACACAAGVAKNLGYADLAALAARWAMDAAARLDDPIGRGKAAFSWLLNMPRSGSWNRTLSAAETAVDGIQPYASDGIGLQVMGMLTLTSALAAATVHRHDAAWEWLGEAKQIASHVPDDVDANWQAFSATNVAVWDVMVAVERGETGGTVLELARRVDETKLLSHPSRRACFFADVGRGLAREPRMGEQAVRWLRKAEEITPQRIRNNGPVREAVSTLLGQARASAGGRELRGMAARMGVPH